VDSLTGKPLGRQDCGHGAATRRSARRTELAAGHRGNDDGGDAHRQLAANREQLELLERARREPWLLDDATVDRVKKVFGVQRDDMWLWEENGRRWQALDLDTATRAQVDGYMSLAAQFATTNTAVLALADEIAGGTINKVMAKSDLELGIEALHRDGPI
jgi:hypothetical protein